MAIVVSVGAGHIAAGMWLGRLSVAFMCHVIYLNFQSINRTPPNCARVFVRLESLPIGRESDQSC